jgi:putative ABC transport system substrate-binding protein
MKRREFLCVLGGSAAWPLVVGAQQPANIPRIGILWAGASPPAPPRMESFREGLRDLGYIDGQNVIIEIRHAPHGVQQLPELAAELVRLKVDVIQASGDLAPKVAQKATTTIPIVAVSDDILGAGIVNSLARPGGNTTGLNILSPELTVKRLQLLKDLVPNLSRVTGFSDPTTGSSQVVLAQEAARSLGLTLDVADLRQRDDVAKAFRAARNSEAQAIKIFSSPFLAALHREIIDLAAEHRVPVIYQWKEHADAGGLISYGLGLAAMFRQVAGIVVKILKGAKPADLPIEQPTKFDLVINLKTAKTLGLNVSPQLQLLADHVIE